MGICCRASMSGRDWLKFFKADLLFGKEGPHRLIPKHVHSLVRKEGGKGRSRHQSQAAAVIFAGQDQGLDLIRSDGGVLRASGYPVYTGASDEG